MTYSVSIELLARRIEKVTAELSLVQRRLEATKNAQGADALMARMLEGVTANTLTARLEGLTEAFEIMSGRPWTPGDRAEEAKAQPISRVDWKTRNVGQSTRRLRWRFGGGADSPFQSMTVSVREYQSAKQFVDGNSKRVTTQEVMLFLTGRYAPKYV